MLWGGVDLRRIVYNLRTLRGGWVNCPINDHMVSNYEVVKIDTTKRFEKIQDDE